MAVGIAVIRHVIGISILLVGLLSVILLVDDKENRGSELAASTADVQAQPAPTRQGITVQVPLDHSEMRRLYGKDEGLDDLVPRRQQTVSTILIAEDSEYFDVEFDGQPANVYQNRRPSRASTSNNLASKTMATSGSSSTGYQPIRVKVTNHIWTESGMGNGWMLRPTRYHTELSIITDIDTSQLSQGIISFTINQPCQVSVELGDQNVLFRNDNAFKAYSPMIVAANPPYSEFPKAMPTLTRAGSNPTCQSAYPGRSCVVAMTDNDCTTAYDVPVNTDLYFSSQVAASYVWGDGCGLNPKIINLQHDARVFLDEDTVIYARVIGSNGDRSGVYGYGIFTTSFMNNNKVGSVHSIVASGSWAEFWGFSLMQSTYRNANLRINSSMQWTKSFAWLSETDCVEGATGRRVFNNFFKVNDDCIKLYQRDCVYDTNIVWHSNAGRAIMISWGNPGENRESTDSSVQALNTYIIHDGRAFGYVGNGNWHNYDLGLENTQPDINDIVQFQRDSITWPGLIGLQHPNGNTLGKADSPIIITNVYVEGQIGQLFQFQNGFTRLGGTATWQPAFDGISQCTGNANIRITNLNLQYVTSLVNPSVMGGCDMNYQHPSLANGACICRDVFDPCASGSTCATIVEFNGWADPLDTSVPGLTHPDFMVEGMNLQVTYNEATITTTTVTAATTTTTTTGGGGGSDWWVWLLVSLAGVFGGLLFLGAAALIFFLCCSGLQGVARWCKNCCNFKTLCPCCSWCWEKSDTPEYDSKYDPYHPGGVYNPSDTYELTGLDIGTPAVWRTAPGGDIAPYRVAAVTPLQGQSMYPAAAAPLEQQRYAPSMVPMATMTISAAGPQGYTMMYPQPSGVAAQAPPNYAEEAYMRAAMNMY